MATTPQEKPPVRGPELEAYQVVIRPILSEKGTHQSQHHSAYPFEVNPWATKDEIKAAIQELFNVRVLKVRTQNRQGKVRRFKFRAGRLAHWKKAIVTLHPDDGIDFY
jgi:large subunit ribosomal protein L23